VNGLVLWNDGGVEVGNDGVLERHGLYRASREDYLNIKSTGYFHEVNSLCKKRPNTALLSFLKQSFTSVNSLFSNTSKALSLTFSYQSLKMGCFLSDTKYFAERVSKIAKFCFSEKPAYIC
jgi:hypothetical protein